MRSATARRLHSGSLRFRLWLEQLEQRVAPASTVIPLNNFGNEGATLRGFQDNTYAG